ncbi:unnamed protein product [Closterium sp. Naga37s-1]|nr:unnamed protein product [Closterium sp. Naga37s-1]
MTHCGRDTGYLRGPLLLSGPLHCVEIRSGCLSRCFPALPPSNNAQSHVSRPSVAVQGKARSAVVPVASCAARAGGCRAWSSVGRGNGWQQMPAHVAGTSEAAGNRHAFIRAQSGSGTAVGIVLASMLASYAANPYTTGGSSSIICRSGRSSSRSRGGSRESSRERSSGERSSGEGSSGEGSGNTSRELEGESGNVLADDSYRQAVSSTLRGASSQPTPPPPPVLATASPPSVLVLCSPDRLLRLHSELGSAGGDGGRGDPPCSIWTSHSRWMLHSSLDPTVPRHPCSPPSCLYVPSLHPVCTCPPSILSVRVLPPSCLYVPSLHPVCTCPLSILSVRALPPSHPSLSIHPSTSIAHPLSHLFLLAPLPVPPLSPVLPLSSLSALPTSLTSHPFLVSSISPLSLSTLASASPLSAHPHRPSHQVALLQAIHSSALFSPSAPPLALTFLSDSTPHRYPLSPAALSALIRPAGLEVGAGLEEQRAGAGGKHGRESRAEVGYDPWMQFLMGSPGPPMELDAPAGMHGGDSLTCHRLPCPDSESLDLMLRAMARDGRDLFDLLRLVRLTHAAMNGSHADMNGSHAAMNGSHADMNGSHAAMNGSHADMNGSHAAMNGSHADMNGSHAAMNGSHADMNGSHAAMNGSHADMNGSHAAMNGSHADMNGSHAAMNGSHADMNGSHAAMNGSHADMNGSHAAMNGSHADMNGSHAAMNGSHADMNGSHAAMNGSHADMNGSHAAMNGSHADMNGSHAAMNGSHADMNGSHAAMNGSHADMDRAHADAASMHLDKAEGNPAPAATAHEAGSSSKQSPPRTHTLSPSAYSSLIRACVNGGQVKEARRLLRDMERRGVPPTQASVNMIAHMHFLHADPDAALSLLHHVRAAQKLPMNAALLTTYVWGLGQAGRVEEAEELLLGAVGGGGGMVGRNGGNGGEGGDGGDGEGMRVAAVQPNVRTWNALMHGYALKGDADAAEGVLGLMRGEGGVMSGGERLEAGGEGELGVGGNVVGAGVGEEEEDEDGGESDGTAEGFWDGDEEYEEGERAGEVRDAEEAGEFSMRREHHLCHQQQQHQQQHEAERPPKRKARFPWPSVRPNTVTYTTLMAAYAAAGRSAEVWDVYREMRSLSIPPNHFTFATLVSSCAARSRPDLIKSVLADVAACQQRADVALVTSVLAGVAGCCSGKKEEAGSVLRWFLGEVESEGGVGEACARLILEDGLSDAQLAIPIHPSSFLCIPIPRSSQC